MEEPLIQIIKLDWKWSYPLVAIAMLRVGIFQIEACPLFCDVERSPMWSVCLASHMYGRGKERGYYSYVTIPKWADNEAHLEHVLTALETFAGFDPRDEDTMRRIWHRAATTRISNGFAVTKRNIKRLPPWVRDELSKIEVGTQIINA